MGNFPGLLCMMLLVVGAAPSCTGSGPAPIPRDPGGFPDAHAHDVILENLSDRAYEVVPGSRLDRTAAVRALERIHRSVGWEHFDWYVGRRFERTLFLRNAGGDLAGYILIERDGYIPNIATHGGCQGRGIGFRLMIEAWQQLGS